MIDPTYDTDEIKKNKVWYLAYVLAQIKDDNAPIGWSRWITTAECLMHNFNITPKKK